MLNEPSKSNKGFIRINHNKSLGGFTIIEVLIVLAIAGLILLIVFLAVPALQRNSHNTQYSSEASRILTAAQEFINNNNLTLPKCRPPDADNYCTAQQTDEGADLISILTLASTKNIINLVIPQAPGGTGNMIPAFNSAQLATGVKCGTSSGNSHTPVTGPIQSIILIYAIENADGSVNARCISS